ncbi:MAG: branched-chain amino acid transaminase [Oscillatoriales cyanobacterium]|nr:MAG: branched-chain amino acid transaminase [Oscillatoriales cyanobacterium]
MDSFLPIAYFQNQFLPFTDAKISIATHALHYGTGVLGGLRGIPDPQNGDRILLFRLDRHCQRLSQSASFLHCDIPPDKIQQVITDFVKKNQPTKSFYIRPFIYTSSLGIAPRLHNVDTDFFVYGLELSDYLPKEGVNCRISSWYRQEDRSLPLRGKISGAYITSALAKTEAVESGFDEAIMMNTQGKVSEASGMNIFVARNGKLVTPGFEQDIEVTERPVDKSELLIADEIFLCGTAAKITPINRVENYQLPKNRPITEKILDKLTGIIENRDSKYKEWVFAISLN